MSTPDFLIVFRGATLDSFEQQSVQTQVEAALRLTEDQSGKLFSGKLVVIKRTQDKTDALTLAQRLKNSALMSASESRPNRMLHNS
jgi:hypothetical protein